MYVGCTYSYISFNLHLVLIFRCICSIWSFGLILNSSTFCKVVSGVVWKSVKWLEMRYYKMNAPQNADRCCHVWIYVPSSRKRKSWSEISVLFVDWELLMGTVHSSTEQKTAEMEWAWLLDPQYALFNFQNFKSNIACLGIILQLTLHCIYWWTF